MGDVETGNILCAYNLNFLFKSLLESICREDLLTLTILYPITLNLEWLSTVRSKDLYLAFGLLISEGCFIEMRIT